jgi:fructokinase
VPCDAAQSPRPAPSWSSMIAVTGEALIDFIVGLDGRVIARPGGGPFNTARTIGRLGAAPVFLGRLSQDNFGALLRGRLDEAGVTLAVPEPADAPTTLAVADVDETGVPRYRFYLDGTSAGAVSHGQLAAALPEGMTALYVGSLALLMEPIANGIESMLTSDLPPGTLVMIDPNCRPEAISDHQEYRARLTRLLRHADVVKLSVEDLRYVCPGEPVDAAAAFLLRQGPTLVLITDGPHPVRAFRPDQEITVDVPVVRVVDSIGAGDAFGGAFLTWWSDNALTRADLARPGPVREALHAAVEVAALTCTRAGAEPPWLAEVADSPAWRQSSGRSKSLPLPAQPSWLPDVRSEAGARRHP